VASRISVFFAELKRRKVYHVTVVYVVVGIAVLGAAEVILDPLGLEALRPYVVILVLFGFPIALVLAWAYEVRPEEPREAEPRAPAEPSAEAAPPAPEAAVHADASTAERRKSIVVLPFDNMSPEPGDAYLSDGLTEEIITKLSYNHSLRVISRNSAMVLKGTQKDTRTIAQELDVQFVLEGSVRKSGNDLRITAQLIDAAADEHLWAETYDRALEDVFRVQSDVAEKIAVALRAEFSAAEQERVRQIPTRNLKAYDLYIRAHAEGEGMLPEDLRESAKLAREAIRLDPDFAQAHAQLAEIDALSGFYANERPSDLFPRLQAAATRALELDPHVRAGHSVLAVLKLFYEWDWIGAEEEFAKAQDLHPDDSFAYTWKILFLICSGRASEAVSTSHQALMTDPLSPAVHHMVGQVPLYDGRPGEAIRFYGEAVRQWPHFPLLHLWLGLSHLYAGDSEGALPHLEAAVALSGPVPFFEAIRGVGFASVGRVEEAREVLEDLKARSSSEYVDPYNLFALAAPLDGFDAAAPFLDEAVEVRSFFLPFLGVVPRFRPLHPHPRFQAVVKMVRPDWEPSS
jgi:TolB-like protein